jgi:hypothetical protein
MLRELYFFQTRSQSKHIGKPRIAKTKTKVFLYRGDSMPGKKTNTQKNGRANDLWQEHKKQGRPKQVWVPSSLSSTVTMDELEAMSDAEVLSIVPAHWEKVNDGETTV